MRGELRGASPPLPREGGGSPRASLLLFCPLFCAFFLSVFFCLVFFLTPRSRAASGVRGAPAAPRPGPAPAPRRPAGAGGAPPRGRGCPLERINEGNVMMAAHCLRLRLPETHQQPSLPPPPRAHTHTHSFTHTHPGTGRPHYPQRRGIGHPRPAQPAPATRPGRTSFRAGDRPQPMCAGSPAPPPASAPAPGPRGVARWGTAAIMPPPPAPAPPPRRPFSPARPGPMCPGQLLTLFARVAGPGGLPGTHALPATFRGRAERGSAPRSPAPPGAAAAALTPRPPARRGAARPGPGSLTHSPAGRGGPAGGVRAGRAGAGSFV